MKKRINNNQGFAYMLVLIMLAVFVVLGTSVLAMALGNMKNTVYQEDNLKAYHLAKSGAVALAEYIVDNPSTDVTGMMASSGTSPITHGNGQFDVKVVQSGSNLILRSKGVVRGANQTVEVVMVNAVGHLLDYTILSLNEISFNNHTEVVGGLVATNSTNPSDVSDSPQSITKKEDVTLDAGVPVPVISIPASFDIEENDAVVVSNNSVYPLVSSGVTNVYFEKGISLGNKAIVDISGTGVLNIFVNEGWEAVNHSALKTSAGVQVYIYFLDDSPINISASQFDASIIAPQSTVTFENASGSSSGGRQFHGTILAENVYISGNWTFIEADDDDDANDLLLEPMYMIKQLQ